MAKFKKFIAHKFLRYFLLCIVLVITAYFFFDKPIALWIYQHKAFSSKFMQGLTFIPTLIVALSVGLIFCMFAFSQSNISHLTTEKLSSFILALGFSCYLAFVLTRVLKFIFGRMGPKYWISHHFDPYSYGFSPFHGYAAIYQDFPSGHTAVTFAAIGVAYLAYPKFIPAYIVTGLILISSILLTHNHFFADCIAGAFLGILIGQITAKFFALTPIEGETNKKALAYH